MNAIKNKIRDKKHMIKKTIEVISILCTLLFSHVVYSKENTAYRQHEVHQHGVVMLHIVQNKNDLLIEITAPSNDILGFEHKANTTEDKKALNLAQKKLRNTKSLFEITPNN